MTSDAMKRVFSNNLNRIMYEKHKKQSDIVNTLGFKQPTVSAWMKGEKYPRMDKVQILAEYLGVKVGTVRSWLRKTENSVPAHKIGKQWKFKKSELDLWIKSGKSAM